MASRISRTARSMRGLSTSSGIPLPLDDPGQAIQVGDDESSLRCFDGAYAVHEHRVQARLRSSLHVGDGIVADVYHPVAGDAAHAQRFLEDLGLRLLDPDDRRYDHAVEVASPSEVVEHLAELDVPVGDCEDFCSHLPQMAQHRYRLRVWVEGDPALRHFREDLRRRLYTDLYCGHLRITTLEAGQILLGTVIYVALDMTPQAAPHGTSNLLGSQPAIARVRREVFDVAFYVQVNPQKCPVDVQEDSVVAHPSVSSRRG